MKIVHRIGSTTATQDDDDGRRDERQPRPVLLLRSVGGRPARSGAETLHALCPPVACRDAYFERRGDFLDVRLGVRRRLLGGRRAVEGLASAFGTGSSTRIGPTSAPWPCGKPHRFIVSVLCVRASMTSFG